MISGSFLAIDVCPVPRDLFPTYRFAHRVQFFDQGISMTNDTINDTAVFYSLLFDRNVLDYVPNGDPRMRTREAIEGGGGKVDPRSLQYCPHQWIGRDGYVDPALARQHPYRSHIHG
jgi:hypothetical protein